MRTKDLLKLMKSEKYYHLSIKRRRKPRKITAQKIDFKPYGFWFGLGGSWLKMLLKKKITGGVFGYDMQNYLYEIDIDKEKMFVINSKKQVKEFSKIFLKGKFRGRDIWQKLASKYDGFMVCKWVESWAPKASSNEYMRYEFIWYLDLLAVSGVVWNPRAIKSIKLIAKRNKKDGLWYRA